MEKKMSIRDVVRAERERLKDDPNVIGFGFGPKRIKGEKVPGLSLIYIVRVKCDNAEEIEKVGSQPLPEEVAGYLTDVIEQRPASATGTPTGDRGSRIEDPLVGGTSTTVLSDWHSFPTGYGTLGGICFDSSSGDAMALSNAHVWGMDAGKDVIQPWMPTGEYLEAVVKLLMCGPVISYILDTTIPSPLTVALTVGAGAAWAAAAASDAEDPSRWGQRVGTVPPAGARTEVERVHLEAELPNRPFAGRPYSMKTTWMYDRETTSGTYSQNITQNLQNEHVLIGKSVWTERDTYHGGERVRICAEVVTDQADRPEDYFVVAHCFPKSEPERIVQRVLVPGVCKRDKPEDEDEEEGREGFHGFPSIDEPQMEALFPFEIGVFQFNSNRPTIFVRSEDDPAGVTTLGIQYSEVRISFPPCSHVDVEVYHTFRPVTAKAYDVTGAVVATATTTRRQRVTQTLALDRHDIVQVVVSGGGGEGYIVGIYIDQEQDDQDGNRFVYVGNLDLDLREPADKWGIALFVQTVNDVPVGTDPAVAARTIGGITASNNVADLSGCEVVMLLDHVFDVI